MIKKGVQKIIIKTRQRKKIITDPTKNVKDGNETRDIYNPPAPLLLHLYTLAHFLLSLALLDTLARDMQARAALPLI